MDGEVWGWDEWEVVWLDKGEVMRGESGLIIDIGDVEEVSGVNEWREWGGGNME